MPNKFTLLYFSLGLGLILGLSLGQHYFIFRLRPGPRIRPRPRLKLRFKAFLLHRAYYPPCEIRGLQYILHREATAHMDIYRFFHPHHNPRLLSTPLRQHEISELEQAASELIRALERAKQRCERRPSPPILPNHFKDVIKAMDFVVRSLQTLCDAHEGDATEVLSDLIQERSQFTGWEGWANLLKEHLTSVNNEISISNRKPESKSEKSKSKDSETTAKAA